MNEQEQLLRKIYYDPALGLGTAKSLYKVVNKDIEKKDKIKYKVIKEWIKKQEANQLFHTNKKITYPAIIGEDDDFKIPFDKFRFKLNRFGRIVAIVPEHYIDDDTVVLVS